MQKVSICRILITSDISVLLDVLARANVEIILPLWLSEPILDKSVDWEVYESISDCILVKSYLYLLGPSCFERNSPSNLFLEVFNLLLRDRQLLLAAEHAHELRVPALKGSIDISALNPETTIRLEKRIGIKVVTILLDVVFTEKVPLSHSLWSKHLSIRDSETLGVICHGGSCSMPHNFKDVFQFCLITGCSGEQQN